MADFSFNSYFLSRIARPQLISKTRHQIRISAKRRTKLVEGDTPHDLCIGSHNIFGVSVIVNAFLNFYKLTALFP